MLLWDPPRQENKLWLVQGTALCSTWHLLERRRCVSRTAPCSSPASPACLAAPEHRHQCSLWRHGPAALSKSRSFTPNLGRPSPK